MLSAEPSSVPALLLNNRSRPSVSIVISSYNAAEFLPQALASLKKLSYRQFEVIVVDAGSTDRSVELVRGQYPWVRLVALPARVGIGAALNIGARQATGEILVLGYNTDEIAQTDWLTHAVAALQLSPHRSIVGTTRLLHGTEDLVDECGVTFYAFGISTKRFHGRRLQDCPNEKLQRVDSVGLMVMERGTYEELGPLEESFFVYGEDTEYCLRLKQIGGHIFVTPQSLTWHESGVVISKGRTAQQYYLRRSMLAVVLIHFPLLLLPVAALGLGSLVFVDFAMTISLFARFAARFRFPMFQRRRSLGEFAATLRGYGWNIAHLPELVRTRRKWRDMARRLSEEGDRGSGIG
jgi:hypothetical protein